jgi:hypothetical protein
MKLTDNTPRVSFNPEVPLCGAENVQVSYRRKCARNKMDWMTETNPMSSLRECIGIDKKMISE